MIYFGQVSGIMQNYYGRKQTSYRFGSFFLQHEVSLLALFLISKVKVFFLSKDKLFAPPFSIIILI